MNKIIEKLETIFPTKESNSEIVDIKYLSFDDQINGMNISVKKVQLDKIGEENLFFQVTNDFLEVIKNFPQIEDEGLFHTNIVGYSEEEVRRLFTKITLGSNYIAAKGRIGSATHILINSNFFNKLKSFWKSQVTSNYLEVTDQIHVSNSNKISKIYSLDVNETNSNSYTMEKVGNLTHLQGSCYLDIIVDDRVLENEIFLYRKNEINQPGVIFIWNNENNVVKYQMTSLGFFPDKQFLKITINE